MSGAVIPAVSAAPLTGNLMEVRRDWLGLLRRLARECGPVGSFRLGPRRAYVFNDPALASALE